MHPDDPPAARTHSCPGSVQRWIFPLFWTLWKESADHRVEALSTLWAHFPLSTAGAPSGSLPSTEAIAAITTSSKQSYRKLKTIKRTA